MKIFYCEFDMPDDFKKGDCYKCQFQRTETINYDDDGYLDCDIIENCDLGGTENDCPLKEKESILEKEPETLDCITKMRELARKVMKERGLTEQEVEKRIHNGRD